MNLGRLTFAAALLLGASLPAQAVTIDFEELTPNVTYNSPLVVDGFVFTNGGDPNIDDGVDAFFAIEPGSNGTLTLAPNFFGSVTTFAAEGGEAFTLTSLDFSDPFDFADDPIQVDFTFNTLDGVITETVFADFTAGMQTEFFNISGITSFSFVSSGSLFGENTIQLDNIVVNVDDVVPGIPEPATWAMMIGGFGLVGASARAARRRSVAA